MKNLIKTTMLLALVGLMTACAGGVTTPGTARKPPKDYSIYPTLGDALRTVGGLQVAGTGQSLTVVVRGGAINSMTLSSLPLFVIDRVPVGTSYNDVASLVNPVEIESIKVLNGTRAVTVYGEPGNAGVIEIKTKRNK